MNTKSKPNYRLLALGGAFLLPPGWIVFQGIQNLAHIPAGVALFTVAALAVGAIVIVFQGLQNLQTGDVKDATVKFAIAGLAILAEFVGQWWFAITEGHALVTALILSMLSLLGAVIVEGEIMRVWKANARSSGQMALARAHAPVEVKKFYPAVADRFTRLAVRYPNATQTSILDRAFREYDEAATVTVEVVQTRQDINDLDPKSGQKALTADGEADQAADRRTVSDLVKEAMSAHPADKQAAMSAVIRTRPGVNPDTVRKTYDRLAKPRSA